MACTTVAAILALCLAVAWAGDDAAIRYGPGRQLCELANPEIDESSGLAASRRSRDVFWTHNDSGDGPRLFAFNRKGDHLATCRVQGARARDWEDMASFRRGSRSYLLVGDVGDNAGARRYCTLYLVPEPRLDPAKRAAEATVAVALTIEFAYADGPQDCEAVAIDPTGKAAYVMTKAIVRACKVYAVPLAANPRGKPWVVKAIASRRIPTVTAMDMSPDGRRAIVLTYAHACEFTRRPDETWAAAFARAPRIVAMPPRIQGESVCYGPDGKTLYLTSEKTPTPLLEVPVVEQE